MNNTVVTVDSTQYQYDNNGNMEYRSSDNRTIEWDAENRPVSISVNDEEIASFVYDGDGNRVKQVILSEGEGSQEVLYINRYYEVNLTSENETSHYYLGGKQVALMENTEVRFMHQDHLTGTALMTDTNGDKIGEIMKYFPYGETRSGGVLTDKKFTGQRLDSTGLYYYNARYYDPEIGRFISADTIIPDPANPQSFNRYSYCLNNPLKYVDPSGHIVEFENEDYLMSLPDVVWAFMDTDSWLGDMVEDWAEDHLEWEGLMEDEEEITQDMIDSVITFSIVDIDRAQKMITFNVIMRGRVKFDKPVQLYIVGIGQPKYDEMDSKRAPAMCSYSGIIYIRNDKKRTPERFTWEVAHELFHSWEKTKGGHVNALFWHLGYAMEVSAGTPHDYWPSEIRANEYASFFYGGRRPYPRTYFKGMDIW
ncbi:RHS repeat domain-containing protein [Chloroflexota bacterium]